MSLHQIRTRINALRRKFAIPLAVMRLRRHADPFCLHWSVAHADQQPLPEPHQFIRQIAQDGLHLPFLTTLHRYLDRCNRDQTQPDPHEIARCLFPWAARRGLLTILPDPDPNIGNPHLA